MSILQIKIPRLVIAGLRGDAGKSLISLGLVRAFRSRGIRTAPFKKGPDFIDAAWLGAAAEAQGRNLDTFLMNPDVIKHSIFAASKDAGISVIEGNRGLFDGLDYLGSHSTAELAKLIGAPVILVIEATKTTRTVAALVKGCQVLDPELNIAGIILNRLGTARQESVIRQAILCETGIPVVGAVPKLGTEHLPSRHLGLVTAMEHPDVNAALDEVEKIVSNHVDLSQILELAQKCSKQIDFTNKTAQRRIDNKFSARIGLLRDKAFSFYYPENLEALQNAGAELVEISPLKDKELPQIDGLYAGGGFPEVHAEELANNERIKEALRKRILDGLPVWAECGGLMYLARSLEKDGKTYPMVGALPIDIEHTARPKGHGYVEAQVDGDNAYFESGTKILGHEFHYSRIKGDPSEVPTVFKMKRGTGIGNGRDGIKYAGIVATYTHIHALSVPCWTFGLMKAIAKG